MWICTTLGFFSTVCPDKSPTDPRLDPTRRMIRARSVKHLENLIEHFPDQLGGTKILHTGSDYKCRIIVDAEVWTRVVELMAEEIDYGNFKSACHTAKRVGAAYLSFLMSVWSAGFRMEPEKKKQVGGYFDFEPVRDPETGEPSPLSQYVQDQIDQGNAEVFDDGECGVTVELSFPIESGDDESMPNEPHDDDDIDFGFDPEEYEESDDNGSWP